MKKKINKQVREIQFSRSLNKERLDPEQRRYLSILAFGVDTMAFYLRDEALKREDHEMYHDFIIESRGLIKRYLRDSKVEENSKFYRLANWGIELLDNGVKAEISELSFDLVLMSDVFVQRALKELSQSEKVTYQSEIQMIRVFAS